MTQTVVAIRVDGDNYAQQLRDFLTSDGAALCVRETVEGENPHYHAVLHSDRKVPAIRMALKRMLGITGNGQYSLAEVRDLDKYQRYMMKGPSADVMPEIIAAVGIQYQDNDWRQDKHDAFWEEAAQLTKKRKLEPIMDYTYRECTANSVQWHQRERIAKIYISELIARNKPINTFAAKSAINLLQCKLCPDDSALDNIVSSV